MRESTKEQREASEIRIATVIELKGMGGKYFAIELKDGGILRLPAAHYAHLAYRLTGTYDDTCRDPAVFKYFNDIAEKL